MFKLLKTSIATIALAVGLAISAHTDQPDAWYFVGRTSIGGCVTIETLATTPPAPPDAQNVHTPDDWVEWALRHGHPEVKDVTDNYPNFARTNGVVISSPVIEGQKNASPIGIFINGLDHCRILQAALASMHD